MDKHRQSPTSKNKNDLLRYAGLGAELLAAIGIALFAGLKADNWLHTSPLFVVALPLLVLTGIFYKLIRETDKRKNDEQK